MNILRTQLLKFARWVTREERLNHSITLRGLLKENRELRKLLINQEFHVLSPELVTCVVDCLPRPNEIVHGVYSVEEITELKQTASGGIEVYCRQFITGKDNRLRPTIFAEVYITKFNKTVRIPLSKGKMTYNVFGVNTEIETWYWDLYQSGIRVISNSDFQLITEFYKAQKNVLKEIDL